MQDETTTREVHTTDDEQVGVTNEAQRVVSEQATPPANVMLKRVVWFVIGFIIAILALRIFLFLFGANANTSFVDFIYSFTGVFTAPFNAIFPVPEYGRFGLDTAAVVAIIVYALVGWGIGALMDVGKPAGTSSVD